MSAPDGKAPEVDQSDAKDAKEAKSDGKSETKSDSKTETKRETKSVTAQMPAAKPFHCGHPGHPSFDTKEEYDAHVSLKLHESSS